MDNQIAAQKLENIDHHPPKNKKQQTKEAKLAHITGRDLEARDPS